MNGTEDILQTAESSDQNNKKLLRKFRLNHIIDINMIRVFFAVLAVFFVISFIPSLRPSYSESEKRQLTKFPKLTLKDFLSGDFFDGINLWYSDTFPFREEFVAANGYIKGNFGKSNVKIHGTVEEGDDIPDKGKTPESTSSDTDVSNSQPSSVGQNAPPQPAVETLGAVLIIDNAAYEYYNFNSDVAGAYISHISRAADFLDGTATVYDIIIPTSMGITAPESVVSGIKTSDQKKAIDYMYSVMSPTVRSIDIYDILKEHRDEYLYFRTDHHWTALGAYYAYHELMYIKDVKPAKLSDFNVRIFDGFLGSFYSQSGKLPQLAATPDTVIAYEPTQFNTITTTLENGNVVDKKIISDGNALGTSSKYLSFIGGDQPFGVMVNPEIEESKACIVIKESFGNAFVPFLTQNYKYVYVIDYRHFSKISTQKLDEVVHNTGATDVIFVNNISATRSAALVDAIGDFVGPSQPPEGENVPEREGEENF